MTKNGLNRELKSKYGAPVRREGGMVYPSLKLRSDPFPMPIAGGGCGEVIRDEDLFSELHLIQ